MALRASFGLRALSLLRPPLIHLLHFNSRRGSPTRAQVTPPQVCGCMSQETKLRRSFCQRTLCGIECHSTRCLTDPPLLELTMPPQPPTRETDISARGLGRSPRSSGKLSGPAPSEQASHGLSGVRGLLSSIIMHEKRPAFFTHCLKILSVCWKKDSRCPPIKH